MKDEILKLLIQYKIKYRVYPEYIKVNCLYHDERTPSLFIYIETNSFYCYGCNKSGSISDIISKITGKTVQEVKTKYNIKLEIKPIEDQDFANQINYYLSTKIYDIFVKKGPTKELIDYMVKLDDSLSSNEITMKESAMFIKKMEKMLYNISGE